MGYQFVARTLQAPLAYEHLTAPGTVSKVFSLPYENLGPEIGTLNVVVRLRLRLGALLDHRASYGVDADLCPRYGYDLNLEPDE